MYSFDEGHTWETFNLPFKMLIKNINTDPDNTNMTFIIEGINNIREKGENSILAEVDFTGFFNIINKVNDKDNDSTFTPNAICELNKDYTSSPHQCFNGENILFLYKNPSSKCVNSVNFSRKIIISQDYCNCRKDDYECSNGFYRAFPDSNCSSLKFISKSNIYINTSLSTSTNNKGIKDDQNIESKPLPYTKIINNLCLGKIDEYEIHSKYSIIFTALYYIIGFILVCGIMLKILNERYNEKNINNTNSYDTIVNK